MAEARPKRQASQKASEKISSTEATPVAKKSKSTSTTAEAYAFTNSQGFCLICDSSKPQKEKTEKKQKEKSTDHALVWVTIPVGDIARAKKFYGGKLYISLAIRSPL